MRKHSRNIFILCIPHFYNVALKTYLKDTYPGYGVHWVGNKSILRGALDELEPSLLILPGSGDLDRDLPKSAFPAVEKYLAGGGNLLAICAGMYPCFDNALVRGIDGTLRGNSPDRMGLFECSVEFIERPDEHEPKSARNMDARDAVLDVFYFNGPYVVPYGIRHLPERQFDLRKIENAGMTPLLWAVRDDGKKAVQITLAAQKLPGGGYAVVSTNHLETPFEMMLASYKAEIAATV